MSHIRTQIRNRAVALLAAIGDAYPSRIHPLSEDDLPAYLVYTNSEVISADEAAFESLHRQIDLVVEARCQSASDIDTALDDMIEAAEIALCADPTLNGLAIYVIPASIEISLLTEGAQPVGRALLTFSVLTRASSTDPTLSL